MARVIGTSGETELGEFDVFHDIRYAVADRFRRPKPATAAAAHGVVDARKARTAAPQPTPPGGVPTSETECLHLTIWTPRQIPGAALPVLVWIHGGAHMYGHSISAETDGAQLAVQRNLVIVAVNYRLGALGHLWLADVLGEDFQDAGNLALHDQTAALNWVQQNISAFGGDPGSVTLMGQSSGGVDVLTHLASSHAGKLFHRAIVHSATAERCWTIDEAIGVREELLAVADLPHAADLLVTPIEALVRSQETLVSRKSSGLPSTAIPFRPVVDHRLLPTPPLEQIEMAAGCDVPLLIGTNRHDAASWIDLEEGDDTARFQLQRVVTEYAPFLRLSDAADALRVDIGRHPSAAELLEALVTELLYRLPTCRIVTARRHTATYAFEFDYRRAYSDGSSTLAVHSAELPFVFQNMQRERATVSQDDVAAAISKRMGAAWAAFAHEGRPSTETHWPSVRHGHFRWDLSPRSVPGYSTALTALLERTGADYKSW